MAQERGIRRRGDRVSLNGVYVQSLERGLEVIRSFDAGAPRQTLADVAAATGLSRATARRFLLTLVELGYVRSEGRIFSLTPRVLELGFSYLSALTLPEVAQPHLETLSRVVHESVSVSVLDGDDIVYVARVPARRIMSVRVTIGTRFPAHATSMGRVLLAALPPSALDAYFDRLRAERLTETTVVDPVALRATLADVPSQGWSIVDQELERGLRSVAAPIRKGGEVVAAVNVATSTATTTQALRGVILDELLHTAAAISRDLEHVSG